MIAEVAFDQVVSTTQLHTEMPWAAGTCVQYSFTAPDFPKPLRISGVNFYRRTEVRAWVKAYKAKKSNRRNSR